MNATYRNFWWPSILYLLLLYFNGPCDAQVGDEDWGYVEVKVRRTILPKIQWDGAAFIEAIQVLREESAKHDEMEPDPERKGLNFVILKGAYEMLEEEKPPIHLYLSNIPLRDTLIYLAQQAGLEVELHDHAVVFGTKGDFSELPDSMTMNPRTDGK